MIEEKHLRKKQNKKELVKCDVILHDVRKKNLKQQV